MKKKSNALNIAEGDSLIADQSFDCFILCDDEWIDGTSFPTDTEVRVESIEEDGIMVEDEIGNLFFIEQHNLNNLHANLK